MITQTFDLTDRRKYVPTHLTPPEIVDLYTARSEATRHYREYPEDPAPPEPAGPRPLGADHRRAARRRLRTVVTVRSLRPSASRNRLPTRRHTATRSIGRPLEPEPEEPTMNV